MDDWKTKGIIMGMESLGAKYRGMNPQFIYFDIPKGSPIDDDQKLKRAHQGCYGLTGLTIKIRRVDAK